MVKGVVRELVEFEKKQESLIGSRFMEVELLKNGAPTGEYLVAIDRVGVEIGDKVLITTGDSSRFALYDANMPCDAAIVGIVK